MDGGDPGRAEVTPGWAEWEAGTRAQVSSLFRLAGPRGASPTTVSGRSLDDNWVREPEGPSGWRGGTFLRPEHCCRAEGMMLCK